LVQIEHVRVHLKGISARFMATCTCGLLSKSHIFNRGHDGTLSIRNFMMMVKNSSTIEKLTISIVNFQPTTTVEKLTMNRCQFLFHFPQFVRKEASSFQIHYGFIVLFLQQNSLFARSEFFFGFFSEYFDGYDPAKVPKFQYTICNMLKCNTKFLSNHVFIFHI
jgi:hypothetical protein